MKNKYEARLGTERMLPLVFKMALPAVEVPICQPTLQYRRSYLYRAYSRDRDKPFYWYRGDHLHRDLDLLFLRYCGERAVRR